MAKAGVSRMTYTYTESFTVDIAHADVAYKLFDMWKALGYDVKLDVSTTAVSVSYSRTCFTIDKENTDETTM